MTPLGDITHHLWLVRRMARATGADLVAAVHEGQLAADDWSQMITNCRGCACAEQCGAKLADLERSDDGRAQAPLYCENRVTFDRLAKQPA